MSAVEAEDLVDDRTLGLIAKGRRLTTNDDTLGHIGIARQISDIARLSKGQENIAVFAPWGAGKSSLFALIDQELKDRNMDDKAPTRFYAISFDASTTAGKDFSVNFLSEVSRGISKSAGRKAQRDLFQSRRSLEIPFGPQGLSRFWRFFILLAVALFLLVGLPYFYTGQSTHWTFADDWFDSLVKNIIGWFSYAVSGTVVLALVTFASDFLQVTVEEASPNHFTQFRRIFDSIVNGKNKRYVIFIDELDRCTPDALLSTLEGLRSFLGHDNCTFVAAFDRTAVATVISERGAGTGNNASAPSDIQQSPEPYYRTAGEYLDKIFQYQLSLPPQDLRTFRRYAFNLVKDRRGIWEEIRESANFSLDDVVALLSPAHVVSARRTKILLNDFALACREFQTLLGDSWLQRVDEIAVHAVIKTEFPALAEHMTTEPDLPRYIVDKEATPARKALLNLVKQYRERSIDLDATSDTNDPESVAVRKEMHRDLSAYLTRALTIGARLPRPDITRRASSPLVTTFEDAGLFLALVRAADEPIAATVDVLATASPADFANARSYLDQQIEKETLRSDARTLAAVLGELSQFHKVDERYALALCRAWNSMMRAGNDLSWATPAAVQGLALGPVIAGSVQESITAIKLLDEQGLASGELLATLIEHVPTDHWSAFVRGVTPIIVRSVRMDPRALSSAIKREDIEGTGWLNDELIRQITKEVEFRATPEADPAQAEPKPTTAADIADAILIEEAAAAAAIERLQVFERSLLDLLELDQVLRNGETAATWIVKLSAILAARLDSADGPLAQIVERATSTQIRTNYILTTIAEEPAYFASRWRNLSTDADPIVAARAFISLVDALIAAADRRVVDRLLTSMEDISPLVTSAPPGDPKAIGAFLNGIQTVAGDEAVRDGARLLKLLPSAGYEVDEVDALAINFYARLATTAKIQEDLIPYLQCLRSTAPTIRRGVQTRILALTTSTSGMTQVLVTLIAVSLAHEQIKDRQVPRRPPISAVRSSLPNAPDVHLRDSWLELGPHFKMVKGAIGDAGLATVSAETWGLYAKNSGSVSRNAAWRYLYARRHPASKMSAIAASGVDREIYAQLAARIISGTVQDRASAAKGFRYCLQQGTSLSATFAVEVALKLAEEPRVGDLPTFEYIVLPNRTAFSETQLLQVRTALSKWPRVMSLNMMHLRSRLSRDLA